MSAAALDEEDVPERGGAGAGGAGVGGAGVGGAGAGSGCDAAFLTTLTVILHETPEVAIA
jgi:hypothetical protein